MIITPAAYLIHHPAPLGLPPELPPGKVYAFIMAGNGLFKLARSSRIEALIPIARARVAGLPELAPYARLVGGVRLPGLLLAGCLRHAREAARHSPRETMYHWRFDPASGEVTVRTPEQVGTAGRVAYTGGDDAAIVLDLHSHHTMDAYFSATDNRDEQGFRFYGVLGRLDKRPQLRLRVGVYGHHWPVRAADLFDLSGELAPGVVTLKMEIP